MTYGAFTQKIKNGRPYYYIREIARVDGKPTVVSQVYLGSLERILALTKGEDNDNSVAKIKVEEFGALWLANLIDQDVDISGLIDSIIPNPDEPEPNKFFHAIQYLRQK